MNYRKDRYGNELSLLGYGCMRFPRKMGMIDMKATEEPLREGAHVFAHSRKDGKEGVAYCIINNSETDATTVELPKTAEVYKLHADTLRATVMKLNGRDLVLGEGNELPDLAPDKLEGTLTLESATIAFVVL